MAYAHRFMTALDMNAWVAVRMIGTAASYAQSLDPDKIMAYMRGPDFQLGAYRGLEPVGPKLERPGAAGHPAVGFRPHRRVDVAAARVPARGDGARIRSAPTSRRRPARCRPARRLDRRMRYRLVLALILLLLLASPARAYMAYASNEKDNTISVIDLDKMQVVKTVPTGQRPRGMALTSDGKRLLVCLGDSNRIDIFDTATWQVVGSIDTPDPEYAALRLPENNPLYVSNENNALITVWNIDTQKQLVQMPTGVEPEGMAVSPDGQLIVNTTETTNMAQFFSYATGKNLANVLVPATAALGRVHP